MYITSHYSFLTIVPLLLHMITTSLSLPPHPSLQLHAQIFHNGGVLRGLQLHGADQEIDGGPQPHDLTVVTEV